MHKEDNPKEAAIIVSKKYIKKGYALDFSIESLENEIDKILEKENPKDWIESAKLESELTAYIGETICQIFDAKWKGEYYSENSGMNFYTCKIEKNGFEFGPSHFVGYYLSNGKESEGSFEEYLHSRDYSKGIFYDFLGGGLINKISGKK
ncbi:hypothetical protein GCM10011344_08700 [Dokdonia pacifica]|uniref:Uncharacterized protein n=1 Tax=Dokdonia pacifica TaxID=1627892 RepID=A0A238YTS7_9FLAO|nr:hypothetical protein [Dokdonia pacifica]GGG10317.1 hypothetical protein GCM10011344_08700 [Dokdonia pacifica]SNR74081.1 hypothetical protein SAMN06265376_102327 [Dokdonia pacifica]